MIRRFCYTGRKQLLSDQVTIRVNRRESPATFTAALDLGPSELPGSAHVFLEAYHKSSYMRFAWGTVEKLLPPSDRRLTAIESPDSVHFRVKVVSTDRPHGRLLAEADRISPLVEGAPDHDQFSLLPVKLAALGEQVWKLNLHDESRPFLELNAALAGANITEFARQDRVFRALVMPAALRQILTHYWQTTEGDLASADDAWCTRWVRFAEALEPLPSREPLEADEARIWIDDVVARFSERHQLTAGFRQHLASEESQS